MIACFIFSFLIPCLVTYFLIPPLCSVALKFGIVDAPDGVIKRHEKITPYLGGLALYIGFITGMVLFLSYSRELLFLVGGATGLLFVGLLDDRVVLKPSEKFLGQLGAGLLFIYGNLFLKSGMTSSLWVAVPLSLFWILSLTNAFNLVDIMDGLATTLALGAGFSFLCCAFLLRQEGVQLILLAFLGPLCAFLWYNRPPARIYLGDAGSLFIGGILATVPFLMPWTRYNPYGFLAPLLILAIPCLELGTLIVIRLYKGIPPYKASPDHFALYLRRGGWKVWHILVYISGMNLLFLGITLLFVQNLLSLTLAFVVGCLVAIIWFLIIFFFHEWPKSGFCCITLFFGLFHHLYLYYMLQNQHLLLFLFF
jgi:UDP-GlcNAc:undecaprenyl-phosphate GlcNAc-1-phosphate transferase